MVHRQDVSVVRLCDVAQEGFNDVSNVPNHKVPSKPQLKHQWRFGSTSPPRLWINAQIIFRIIVSYSNQKPIFFGTNPKGNKKNNLDCKTAELILHIKKAIFINNI